MPSTFEPALPVKAAEVPSGPDWLHEIKHDGFRLMVIRDGKAVRLRSKSGLDWTKRYPWIVETALKLRQERFVLDGEAVLLGVDGISDFDGLQSRKYDAEVQFYAFDMLAGEGDDYRKLPLLLRKQNLAQLLVRYPEGIHAAPFEQGEMGAELFRAACKMGLEGLVSKHRERAYRGGRCAHWVKIKNPAHPGYSRVQAAHGARGKKILEKA